MRKWHLFKEYFLFDNGNQKSLEYMALFCTNEDGSYHKHIDIVYNETSFDVIDDIVDNSYFLFDYKRSFPEVQKILNEKNLIEKIKMIENEDKILPAEAINRKHIIEFHPEATKGDILISIFTNTLTSIILDASRNLFDYDESNEDNVYKYGQTCLIFSVQESIELHYLWRLSCFNNYNELKKYLNEDSLTFCFDALTILLLTLIDCKQINFIYGDDNAIDVSTHFSNLRNNFFEVGSQLSKGQLEFCLREYFGIHAKEVVSKILEYKKAKHNKNIPENMIEILFRKIHKFFDECKVDVGQLIGVITASKELSLNH